jgi:uncharacterized protein (DUF1499 family)
VRLLLAAALIPGNVHGLASMKSRRRRHFLQTLSLPFLAPAVAADAAEFATSAGRKECTTSSDPSKTIVVCRGELVNLEASEVRLSGIAATENGVSTSAVKNPSRYTPPWSYLTETSDAKKAWVSLKEAVQKQAEIVDENMNDKYFYLHAVAPTIKPPGLSTVESGGMDDLEFLLRPADNLVLYRSASRTAVFVYPLTQPVGDGNSNLDRLEKIRATLGWQKLE